LSSSFRGVLGWHQPRAAGGEWMPAIAGAIVARLKGVRWRQVDQQARPECGLTKGKARGSNGGGAKKEKRVCGRAARTKTKK